MTIKDIAKMAGVSVATVSNVINHNDEKVSKEVKRKIQKIIRENGYVPNQVAKSLRKQKTNTIGVITEDITHFQTPSILTGINNSAEKAGKRILLYDLSIISKTGENVERMKEHRQEIDEALNILLAAQVDGIIYVAWQDRDIEDLVREVDVPLVYAYCYSDRDDRPWVSYDNVRIMREIMNKIIGLGHRKIAVAWGGVFCRPAQQRLDVYLETLQQHHIPYRSDYTRHGDWSFDDGMKFYRHFMGLEEPPTAIVFMNDEMAAGAVNESMRTDRKVLNEVSLVGCNDLEYTRFTYPPITTIQLPLEEIGCRAAEMLVRQLEDENAPLEQIVLNCRLIERGSLRQNPATLL